MDRQILSPISSTKTKKTCKNELIIRLDTISMELNTKIIDNVKLTSKINELEQKSVFLNEDNEKLLMRNINLDIEKNLKSNENSILGNRIHELEQKSVFLENELSLLHRLERMNNR
jgi:ABC-type phosphate transport system auxiliary subunit